MAVKKMELIKSFIDNLLFPVAGSLLGMTFVTIRQILRQITDLSISIKLLQQEISFENKKQNDTIEDHEIRIRDIELSKIGWINGRHKRKQRTSSLVD